MDFTEAVKEELAHVSVCKSATRRAELVATLRFAGGAQVISRQVMVEVELDSPRSAQRVREAITELYEHRSELIVVAHSGSKRVKRYVVRVVEQGQTLARQTGLIDARGRFVRGLPANVVNGSLEDAQAVWRGAFLAQGSLNDPGKSGSLEVACPSPEAGLALVGAARRLGVTVKARHVRGMERVVVRESDAIATLLGCMGASQSLATWQEGRKRRQIRTTGNRLANFDDANMRRSTQAALAAGARVARALEILGDDTPEHLKYAGQLRLQYKQASLDELGRRAEPPMTKDAIAGRIRRLLAMADKRAQELGLPSTEASVTAELFEL